MIHYCITRAQALTSWVHSLLGTTQSSASPDISETCEWLLNQNYFILYLYFFWSRFLWPLLSQRYTLICLLCKWLAMCLLINTNIGPKGTTVWCLWLWLYLFLSPISFCFSHSGLLASSWAYYAHLRASVLAGFFLPNILVAHRSIWLTHFLHVFVQTSLCFWQAWSLEGRKFSLALLF